MFQLFENISHKFLNKLTNPDQKCLALFTVVLLILSYPAAFNCLKSAIETPEPCVKPFQS